MNRREFVRSCGFLGFSLLLKPSSLFFFHSDQNKHIPNAQVKEEETRKIFTHIIQRTLDEGWSSLPIGQCMGKIAELFIGTDYAGGTLEGEGPEVCRVDLTGLDCVTFYENVLCMARILKKGKNSFADFMKELTFTRYRKGILIDYPSRLHYTSDWIHDNQEKKVVKNITRELGGEHFPVRVSFMSENPAYYPSLRESPQFIKTITEIEQEINGRKHWFIPQEKIKKAQEHLQTGDIIAVATNKKGLDYSHTGLIFQDKKGRIRFLHASSAQDKVLLDTGLDKYIKSAQTHIGITVARPLRVSGEQDQRH
jgi:hypothetical protein